MANARIINNLKIVKVDEPVCTMLGGLARRMVDEEVSIKRRIYFGVFSPDNRLLGTFDTEDAAMKFCKETKDFLCRK